MERLIYLDNSATTKISEAALNEYVRVSKEQFGNPSSLHSVGVSAEGIMKMARANILNSLYTRVGDIVFTGSGSEANNLAILGRAYARERFRGGKLISSDSEHPSVDNALEKLKKEGYSVAKIATRGGALDLNMLERELSGDVFLVTLMLVNNETGAVYDIPRAARLIREKAPEAYIHVDATQGYMKLPFSPEGLGADLITVSAHKIDGPKGVGALYISPRVIKEKGLSPIIFGGGQEKGIRSGTENVPAIAAFGVAAKDGCAAIRVKSEKMSALSKRLISGIKENAALSEIDILTPVSKAPHIVNITLPNIKSETMLHYLSSLGIFVSSGSACSSNTGHRSAALLAFGRTERQADCSIRISFSAENTENDVDELISALESGLKKLSRIR